MICRGSPHSSPGCATCPSTTTRTGSCLRCSTIPCRTSWPPRNTLTTAPPRLRLSSPWSSGTGCWRTCRWDGWRSQTASTSHHRVCGLTAAWTPGGCKLQGFGCVGKFLYYAVKRWNSFTFLSFSTKFRGPRRPNSRTEQEESVTSIRDKMCCNFSFTKITCFKWSGS